MSPRNIAARIRNGTFGRLVYPVLPGRWRLPWRYRLHLAEEYCEPELRQLEKIGSNQGEAIDIGANEGFYAYKLAKYYSRVYAFEINDGVTADLAAYKCDKISLINKGLSSGPGQAVLYIPVLHGLPLTGWASLAPNNCPDTSTHLEKPVEVCRLDTFDFGQISFIKIDVEGHELEVLRGGIGVIRRFRPRVLIEVKEGNREKVDEYFARLDYRRTQLVDLVGVEGMADNFIYIPK